MIDVIRRAIAETALIFCPFPPVPFNVKNSRGLQAASSATHLRVLIELEFRQADTLRNRKLFGRGGDIPLKRKIRLFPDFIGSYEAPV